MELTLRLFFVTRGLHRRCCAADAHGQSLRCPYRRAARAADCRGKTSLQVTCGIAAETPALLA